MKATAFHIVLLTLWTASSGTRNPSGSNPAILIVGGSPAEEKEFPYQLSLQINSRAVCGASLIAPNYVLTAAHCAVLAAPADFVVLGGGIRFNDTTVQTRKVANISIHSGFNKVFWVHDIALMKLISPFEETEHLRPVELIPKLDTISSENAIVTGWGSTREGGFPSSTLLKVMVPIVNKTLCSENYQGWVQETMLCAGVISGGKDSCQGDSGGPLTIRRNEQYYQIGVVSFGNGIRIGFRTVICIYGGSNPFCAPKALQGTAPIGPLRFASPLPFGKWEGVRDGSKFGGRCPEVSAFDRHLGDEDCLNLNVSVPKVSTGQLLPVMVFFHGGAFQNGTGSMYTPDYLMDEDVVYVNPNYRLGVLGFLNTGDSVIRGNMGLKDQALALRWVKDNIQAFGGDPNNITIFGESAGGASVHYLTLSPSTKGLFNKTIAQSGVATPHWACKSTKDAVKYTRKYAKRFNCDTEDSLKLAECLRSKTVAELLDEYKDELGPGIATRPDLDYQFFQPSIEAVIDEQAFLVEHPLKILAEGRAHRVPMLIGATADEGLLSSIAMYNSYEIVENYEKNWENCVRYTFGIPEDTPNAKDLVAKIKEIYFPENSNLTKDQKLEQFTKLFSDAYFLLHMSHCISVQRQFSPIYPYYLSRRGGPSLSVIMNFLTGKGSLALRIAKFVAVSIYYKITGNKPRDYGVCHGDDLAMLFKVERMFNVPRSPNSADYKFSKDMVKLWVDFARDAASMTFRGAEFLKQEQEKPLEYLELSESPKVIDEPFGERVDALKSLGLIELRLTVATK
ncbi:unnamed protein product [Allacma fusca]|uniref:Peptidase S1 domain-containing protein n=1 Tax=Allacma fusca TaxID=39272 RepID=A0A8J2NP99_9HEXA|nr:unnamed protein product [Allacma fusca]